VKLVSKAEVKARQVPGGERQAAILAAEVPELETIDDYVREISSVWNLARANLIVIGRYLNKAKAAEDESRIPYGEFMKMCREKLPFGYDVAHQLRTVAAAIDGGRFKENELPSAYSIAYQIVTLDEKSERKAREMGLVSPQVRKSAVLAFKKSLRPQPPWPTIDRSKLEAEKARLLARLKEIQDLLDGGGATIDITATVIEVDADPVG
jgi:hypothetical protein